MSRPIGRRPLRLVLRAALVAVAAAAAARLAFEAAVAFLPYPAGLDRAPRSGTWIDDRNGRPLAAFVGGDGAWRLPLGEADVPERLRQAIVAVEDARFYGHAGVDWTAAAAAAWRNLTALGIRRGASTITMQVQRLRDPRPRTIGAKVLEAIRARQIETTASKAEILLEYLNRAPFGGNVVGAGAASWRYFGRPCKDLSLAQAALLAGLPQGPSRYAPDRFPLRALARRNFVLQRMRTLRMITPAEEAAALAEPLDASLRPLPQEASMRNGALPLLVELAARRPGHRLVSTIDASVQEEAARAAQVALDRLAASGVTAAAIVVLDVETAQCLAAVSLARDAQGVDLVRRARSTGSALKPFLYAAAFEAGVCGPETILDDAPSAWPGYEPENYDRQFLGPIPAREALAESRNIPALVILARTGVPHAIGVLESLGFRTLARTPDRYGLSLAIGGAEATPFEMAEAYATLARGGVQRPIRTAKDGEPDAASPARSLEARACWRTLAALSDPERTARICPAAAGRCIAWKTGTSSGHRDAWCAAATRARVVVVWLGNPDGRGARALVGAEAAAPAALGLLASLDRIGAPWPKAGPADDPPRLTFGLAKDRAGPALAIVSPADGQEFVVSDDQPLARQRILLRCAGGQARGRRWWFVDGRSIGTARPDEPLPWAPVPGAHAVLVTDETGNAARASIHVR